MSPTLWNMPLLGAETEYGILAPDRPDLHPSAVSAAVVDGYPGPGTRGRVEQAGEFPLDDAHNRFLGNGARLYVDHAHPEYSTPEVTSPWAALLADLASMIAAPLTESRLPVGSSASRIAGLGAIARAKATRCCSPPDICAG